MNDDALTLQDLREIVLPPAPPFWPLAPGLWIALGLLTLLAALLAWTLCSRRQRNAYRGVGLTLLNDARSSHDVSVLLKRVALAAYPREQVASLYGDEWLCFLANTCPEHNFTPLVNLPPTTPLSPTTLTLARTWITHHHPPT